MGGMFLFLAGSEELYHSGGLSHFIIPVFTVFHGYIVPNWCRVSSVHSMMLEFER